MKRNFSPVIVLTLIMAFTFNSLVAQTKWTIDKTHTNVKFVVTHMTISEVEGYFKTFTGTVENTKADFTDAKVNFTVDVRSVNTDNERRDGHLKSPDFFNAAEDSLMTFVSTGVKSVGGNKYEIAGNLTIRKITKPVVFQATYGGTITTKNGAKAGFKAKTTIDRFAYNLKWDAATEAGGLVVGKDVDIVLNVELNQVKPATAGQ